MDQPYRLTNLSLDEGGHIAVVSIDDQGKASPWLKADWFSAAWGPYLRRLDEPWRVNNLPEVTISGALNGKEASWTSHSKKHAYDAVGASALELEADRLRDIALLGNDGLLPLIAMYAQDIGRRSKYDREAYPHRLRAYDYCLAPHVKVYNTWARKFLHDKSVCGVRKTVERTCRYVFEEFGVEKETTVFDAGTSSLNILEAFKIVADLAQRSCILNPPTEVAPHKTPGCVAIPNWFETLDPVRCGTSVRKRLTLVFPRIQFVGI
jgi:hypothetical protein